MKKRTRMILAALVLALLLAAAAAAAEAPDLTVDGGGRVDFRGPAGETLYLAAYDPATGRFLGLLENGSLVRDSAALKLIAVNAAYQPTEEAARVLVISGPGTYGSGGFDAYDQVVVTAGADGKVTLENLTVGSLTVYGGGDLDLKDVTVTGELRVETAGEPESLRSLRGSPAAGTTAAAPRADGEGLPSIRILGTSGVGSVRIVQTADGGVRLRTEEGCRVDWVLVDDGRGEIILDGDFNQVVVDTAGAGVHLEGAEVSGLTLKKAGADVSLDGETSVTAVRIPAEAEGAGLTAEEGSRVASVMTEAPGVTVTGAGKVIRAEVSGDSTRVETLGTWLSVDKGAEGVTQAGGEAAAPGVTVKTGTAAQGGSGGQPAQPEAHTHIWAEGCITEATAEAEGSACLVCTVCGVTRETALSYLPYAVTVYADEQDTTGETSAFASLEEAAAWAEAHASRVENYRENQDYVYYPAIWLVGADVKEELRLPAGHTLDILDGGRLTILNGVRVGAGSAPAEGESGEILSDGVVMLPLRDSMKNALIVGEQPIWDAADPENSVLALLPEADYDEEGKEKKRDHTIFLGGGEDLNDGWIRPALSLSGYSAEAVNGYVIQNDCDLRGVFCALWSDAACPVSIRARVRAEAVSTGGEGAFAVTEGGAVFAGELSIGFTGDCRVQVSAPEGAQAAPSVIIRDSAQTDLSGNPTGCEVLGGSLTLHGEQNWPVFPFGPREDDPAALTLTVAEDAAVTMPEDLGWVLAEVSSLVNRGTLILRGDLHLPEDTAFVNEGELILAAFRTGGEETEEDYRFGRLYLEGASMENRGTVTLEQVLFTDPEGGEDGRYAELRLQDGAVLTNGEEGFIDDKGFIFVNNGSTLDNRGLLKISDRAFVETDPGEDLWVIYGGAEAVQEQSGAASAVKNSGVLENGGRLELRGSSLENTGELTNRGDLQVKRTDGVKRTVTLEAVESRPASDEDWDSFWSWLDHDEGSWWRVTDDAFEEGDAFDSRFANGAEGSFLNENSCFLQADILNEGTFTNGSLTAVGEEESGSGAWLRQEGGSFENRGAVVNNGRWEFEDAAYRQSADARFATYNQDGFEVRGGSLTVPSGSAFKNEGYMRLTDRYGEGYAPVDISGFEDFYTAWNQDGNDSNWCDTAAEVYDLEGYLAAAAAQRERRRLNPNTCYSRCDFCGDVTITEDVRFTDFREYWLQTRGTDRWHLWDEETEEWTDCDPDAEGAEPYWAEAGSTLTVAEGATLTLARGSSLRVTGSEEQMKVFIPCLLEVKGTLVLEEVQEGDEENDWEWIEEAFVEIWDFGSFDASAGTVENRGRFEIRWREFGRGEETEEGFLYYPEGRFERPEACPVKGAPDNAVHAAEARTDTGFRNAAASTAPVFYRIYLREDCNVTIGEDLTVAPSVNVEPGSGILVEHGAALTLEGHLWNDGDISVYGDLIVLESADINQHMELGALTGSEEARLIICGVFSVRDHADLTVYPTGSILVLGGELDWRPGSGAAVKVRLPEGVTPEEATDAPVRFRDPDGLVITAEAPVRIDLNAGSSFTLNGIAVGGEGPEDYDGYCGCVSTRFETGGNGEEWRVLQADGDGPGRIVLSGTLAGFEEVRIMKGSADISGLDTGEAVIRISDMWTYTDVNVGSHAVILCESSPEDEGGHGGFGIAAGEGAEIRVEGALMLWDEEADFYGYSTGLTLTVGETTYELSPHIFGARYGDPAVYIGIGDPRAEYELRLGDETLEFEKECPVDGEEKTHLNPPEGKPWFEAGPEHDPGLTLVIRLPEGVTVTFVHVPVKPDWRETED